MARSSKGNLPAQFFFGKVFPWLFILAGAGVFSWGVQNLARARESVDWPKAPGRILSSRVLVSKSTDSDGYSSISYSARVEYEFFVQRRKFTGTRIAYGDYGSSSRSRHEEIVERYPEGGQVEVSYRPSQPEECLLEPGVKGQTWFLPLFGLVFLIPGMAMAIFLPRVMMKRAGIER
jgi:hypothetical protein